MSWPATATDFKTRFRRDFIYGVGSDVVQDADIDDALADAAPIFNSTVWSSTAEKLSAFLFVAAHCLRLNLDAAGGLSAVNVGKGARNSPGGVVESKTVGSVSLSYAIAERAKNSRILSPFLETRYGKRYLQMLMPRMVGNVSVAAGPGIDDELTSQT